MSPGAGEDGQAEVRDYLARLAGDAPLRTQTSLVFRGRDTVWKLKRAVRLPFLDYTTLDARHRFAQREMELNAPAVPGLYRGVLPVTRTGAGLALDRGGEVVDWVLSMARIPDEDFLLAHVPSGLTDALLDALGDMVATNHAAHPSVHAHDASHPKRNAQGNAEAALKQGLPPDRVSAWLQAAERALEAAAPLLAGRAAAGLVRRAHGDLHLGNICIWNGAPVPFDAIEFDEAMATIDLAYDLAFLLMDLDRCAGRPAANRVLNRYVARTGDAALVQLLPAFLSRRAMVRAHVTGEPGYLDAALAYLQPAPGQVVAIGGLPGAGKSTLARGLAPGLGGAPGALVVRSDEIRKRLHGAAPEQRLGPKAYTPEVNGRVDAALLQAVRDAAPHGVIADATFLSPALRQAVAAGGGPFTGIWLHSPLPELARRVAGRSGDASDATTAVLDRLAAVDPGPIHWRRVRADDTALATCRALLGLSAMG